MRLNNRNKQTFWYALYTGTAATYDDYGYENGEHAVYGKPIMARGNISPAKGDVVARQFGDDDLYDKVIILEDRATPIDENAVLWIDTMPALDAHGALKVNANGDIVTPWDYIVRKVARSLPVFGAASIAISKVNVS